MPREKLEIPSAEKKDEFVITNKTKQIEIGKYYPKAKKYHQVVEEDGEELNQFIILFIKKPTLLNEILKRMDKGNKVRLSIGIIKKIMKRHEIGQTTLYRFIDKLIEDDQAIRMKQGILFMNPELFMRGKINRQLEMVNEYLYLKTKIVQKPKKIKKVKLLNLQEGVK